MARDEAGPETGPEKRDQTAPQSAVSLPDVFPSVSRLAMVSALTLLMASGISGCDQPPPAPAPPPQTAAPPMPDGMTLQPVDYEALPGWDDDTIIEALPALRRSCVKINRRTDRQDWIGPGALGGTVGTWQDWCTDLARALPENQPASDGDVLTLREVIRARLQPYAVVASPPATASTDPLKAPLKGLVQGTFTGYYEASLKGSLTRQPGYQVPLYGVPSDLISLDLGSAYSDLKGQTVVGRVIDSPDKGPVLEPYWTRSDIDRGVLEQTLGEAHTPVVAWAADAVDAHILHIQGSGVLDLPDGKTLQVGYAGNNGHRFVGIGRVMLDRGLVPRGQGSMPAIRAWLKDHPEQAESVLQANPRFIFFRALNGPGPLGAMGVPLTEKRSLAVDTRYVALGTPLWLDTVDPDGEPLQRLMVAQDIGSAIRGMVRGDFYWGAGEPALAKAGRMKSSGTYYLLLPRPEQPQS